MTIVSLQEHRRAIAEAVTAGMSLYRADDRSSPVRVRLPDGTVTTTVPLDTRCAVADPPPREAIAYFLGIQHEGKVFEIAQVGSLHPGDTFDLPVDGLFAATPTHQPRSATTRPGSPGPAGRTGWRLVVVATAVAALTVVAVQLVEALTPLGAC